MSDRDDIEKDDIARLLKIVAAYDEAATVTMGECCELYDTGKMMVSPSTESPIVAGNGEYAEFLLPPGRYRIVREVTG